uniref:Uncharacterized protein n=1 Tax=Ailuropoda melanoleuca TaxID=9646 RepID=A0A7N5KQW8_AILME
VRSTQSTGRCKVKVKHFDSLLVKMNFSHVKSRSRLFFCFHQQYQMRHSVFIVSYLISKIWHILLRGSHHIILVICYENK